MMILIRQFPYSLMTNFSERGQCSIHLKIYKSQLNGRKEVLINLHDEMTDGQTSFTNRATKNKHLGYFFGISYFTYIILLV